VAVKIAPALRRLGRSHLSYGVGDDHYATVGAALLDTLAALLGDACTPATREAWAGAYGLLSAVMRDAAHEGIGLAAD
jgi:hemoglobin-like flavoprotein